MENTLKSFSVNMSIMKNISRIDLLVIFSKNDIKNLFYLAQVSSEFHKMIKNVILPNLIQNFILNLPGIVENNDFNVRKYRPIIDWYVGMGIIILDHLGNILRICSVFSNTIEKFQLLRKFLKNLTLSHEIMSIQISPPFSYKMCGIVFYSLVSKMKNNELEFAFKFLT
ncbi:hypothetical protein HZS_1485, partial [Henneguya salminicola]